jgi:hypothetical protein
MGKGRDANDFGAAFAQAVTVASDDDNHMVAKGGDASLFSLMKGLFPEVIATGLGIL